MWSRDQSSCHEQVGYYFIVSTKFGSHKVYFFETLVWKLLLQSETVITKGDRKQLLKVLLQIATEVYYRVCHVLQSRSGIAKCDRSLLQSASGITNCVRYYKVQHTVITKSVSYYKVWRYYKARRNTWYEITQACKFFLLNGKICYGSVPAALLGKNKLFNYSNTNKEKSLREIVIQLSSFMLVKR